MSDDLIKRLRAKKLGKDGVVRAPEKVKRQAADRIAALEAENGRLRDILAEMTPDYELLIDGVEDMGALKSWVKDARMIVAKSRAALGGAE